MTALLATLRYGEIVAVLYALPLLLLAGILTGAAARRRRNPRA